MTAPEPDAEPLELAFSLVAEVDVPSGIHGDDLQALSLSVLEEECATGRWEITVALVDDERLQTLHRDFMGVDTPTDIMTFPLDDPGEGSKGGDLAISVDHALTQAGEWGLSPAGEIQFLVAHGLLHLLGWRDDTDEELGRMLVRQQDLIDRWRAGRRNVR